MTLLENIGRVAYSNMFSLFSEVLLPVSSLLHGQLYMPLVTSFIVTCECVCGNTLVSSVRVSVCVSVCVCLVSALDFKSFDTETLLLFRRYIFIISRSSSYAKVKDTEAKMEHTSIAK